MGIPAWAIAAAAPWIAEKFGITPVLDTYKNIQGIRDDLNTSEAINNLDQFKTSADVRNYRPDGYMSAPNRLVINNLQKQRLGELQKQEALPTQSQLADFEARGWGYDPSFSGAEWTQGLMDTMGVKPDVSNPEVASSIAKFADKAQTTGELSNIADFVQRGKAPDSNKLASFLVTGGEKATNQIKTIAELTKQNNDLLIQENEQALINAAGKAQMGDSGPLNALMMAAGKGVGIAKVNDLATSLGLIKKLETVETGTGNGEERKRVTFDPRTGKEGGLIGQPWSPSAPKITNNLTYNGDKKGIESLVGNMPKAMEEAQTATDSNFRIDKMLGLLDAGAGGTRGYAKATVAPTLELMGIKTQGLTDAQLYQRLAATLSGSLRMQVVGPGPVSNYEQELLKKVSGGGAIGEDAAKELLQFYKQTNVRKINTYNNTVDSISAVAPETAKVYKKIGVGGGQPTPQQAAAELARRKAGRR